MSSPDGNHGPADDVLERARAILNAIAQPAVLIEADGNVIPLNQAAEVASTEVVAGSAAAYMSELLQEQATELEVANEELQLLTAELEERTEAAERGERAMRESERRYRLLFELHPFPMWLFDLETLRFLAVNDAAVEQYGYSREEFLGMTIEQIRPESSIPELRASLSREGAGRSKRGVFVHRLHNGTLRQVEIVSHEIVFDDRPARLVLALDVTERLHAEHTLREREEQLRHAQKMEAVGRLAGGVAHDFNNLLTVITGNLDFARAALPADSPIHADLEEVSAAAQRAATLTRQLLAVSRKQMLHPRLLDLGQAVAQAQRLLQRVIGEDVLLELSLPNQVWAVNADPGQVDQVLLNLVMNARDAMPAGGTITIEVENVLVGAEAPGAMDMSVEAGPYVALTVRDSGAGMDQATREHAMEPFFTTKPAGQGTGLGLATVYGIVSQSGGGIRISSEPGSGTRVSVLLPRANGEVVESARTTPVVSHGYGQTILLVEDEAPVRGVIRRTLERNGYNVLEARHGADALLVWERDSSAISLVITDIVMPELGGRELAGRLRADRPEIPILFLSGYAGGAGGAGALPLSAGEPFLHKPFAGNELLRQVEVLLTRPEGREGGEGGDPPTGGAG